MGCAQSTPAKKVEEPKPAAVKTIKQEPAVIEEVTTCCGCCECGCPKCACDCECNIPCPPTYECMCPCCPTCSNTCRCYLECCDAPCFGCDSMILTEKPAVVPVNNKKTVASTVKPPVPPTSTATKKPVAAPKRAQ